MRTLVFLHGTIIMHSTGVGKSREERVQQSVNSDPSVRDYENYVPIGDAVAKLNKWHADGHEIYYLSSQKTAGDLEKDRAVLNRYGFPEGEIVWREGGKSYAEIAEEIMPDVLIEDDVESDGGLPGTTYYAISPEKKKRIKLFLIKEFEGIDSIELGRD